MKKNTKVILGVGAIFLSIVILLIAAIPASSGLEISISEAKTNSSDYKDRYITTEGFIVPESINWDADAIELSFTIDDDQDNQLDVIHNGVQPDNFSDDVIVIVHGHLLDDKTFEADRVQTRCPSSYEGEDMEDYDSEYHRSLKLNDD